MNYENIVRDFALRTKRNLDTLRKMQRQRPNEEIYEVTQLINSMLGLLIFPQQNYIDAIPLKSMNDLNKEGWPIPEIKGNYPQVENLRQLIRYLRNGIAHCNVEFLCDNNAQINGLLIWNKGRENRITWKAKMSLNDIETISQKFIDLLLNNNGTA